MDRLARPVIARRAAETGDLPPTAASVLSYHRAIRVPKDPVRGIVGRFMAGTGAICLVVVAALIVRCLVVSRHVDVPDALSIGAVHAASLTLAGGLLLGLVLWLRDRATGPWGVDRRPLWSVAAGVAYAAAYVSVQGYVQFRHGASPPYLPEPFTSLRHLWPVLSIPILAAFWLRPPPRYGRDH